MQTLSGVEKAAVLSVTIGSKKAARVFKYLTEDEINVITFEIAKMAIITTESKQKVLSEAKALFNTELDDLLESKQKEVAALLKSWINLGY